MTFCKENDDERHRSDDRRGDPSGKESQILAQIGEEPGFFSQFFTVFGGRTGWVNVLLMVVQTLLFVAGVWAAWMFFLAADPVTQLRFGGCRRWCSCSCR